MPENKKSTKSELEELVRYREACKSPRVTQTRAAQYFGLADSGRNEISEWESGKKIPPLAYREPFIGYLCDLLNLRDDREKFDKLWNILNEKWGWNKLTEKEEQRWFLGLPPAAAPQLKMLIDCRRVCRRSQVEVAKYFGLERDEYNEIDQWETGVKRPPPSYREPFIIYLCNFLGLRNDWAKFDELWNILSKEWGWDQLSEQEKQQWFVSLRPPTLKLKLLMDRRIACQKSYAETAQYFGLTSVRSDEVEQWEKGLEIPSPVYREPFIGYLCDFLSLRDDRAKFDEIWGLLSEEWGWDKLSEEEEHHWFSSPSASTTDRVIRIVRALLSRNEALYRQKWWYVSVTFLLFVIVVGVILLRPTGQIPEESNPLPTSTIEPPNPSMPANVNKVNGTDISSTFDQDFDDWSIEGLGNGKYQEDGYLCAVDARGGSDEWFWKAPAKFIGNQSDAYGGTLSFSLRLDGGLTPEIERQNDVVLVGGGMTLKLDNQNPGRDWTPYVVTLNESGGWLKDDGVPPTQEEMRQILSLLTKLKIRGEYRNGEDRSCLDNVVLHRPQ